MQPNDHEQFTPLEKALLPGSMLLSKDWPLSVGRVSLFRSGKCGSDGDVVEVAWRDLRHGEKEREAGVIGSSFEEYCFVLGTREREDAERFWRLASAKRLNRRQRIDLNHVAELLLDYGCMVLAAELRKHQIELGASQELASHLHSLLVITGGYRDEHV